MKVGKWSYGSAPAKTKYTYQTTGKRGSKTSIIPKRPTRPATVAESSEESEPETALSVEVEETEVEETEVEETVVEV